MDKISILIVICSNQIQWLWSIQLKWSMWKVCAPFFFFLLKKAFIVGHRLEVTIRVSYQYWELSSYCPCSISELRNHVGLNRCCSLALYFIQNSSSTCTNKNRIQFFFWSTLNNFNFYHNVPCLKYVSIYTTYHF